MVRLVLKRAKATAGLEEGSGEPVVSNANRHMPNLEIFSIHQKKTKKHVNPVHFDAAIWRDFDAICSELLRFVETTNEPLIFYHHVLTLHHHFCFVAQRVSF